MASSVRRCCSLFSFISTNWRGQPLVDHQTIIGLIGATTTANGLRVECALDDGTYEKGRKVSDAEMAAVGLSAQQQHRAGNAAQEGLASLDEPLHEADAARPR